MLDGVKREITLIVLVSILGGCASIRTEFFRGETRYLYNRGCQHYKQGDYDAAREAFENVLAMAPDYGRAHAALGNIALSQGDHKKALIYYGNAIEVEPELKNVLHPFIMVATVQTAMAPLLKAGSDLRQVYRLMMADKLVDLERVLAQEVPLDLLARDTLSITTSERSELCEKMAADADPAKGSVRYRLFGAYLLFYSQKKPVLAAALIEQAAPEAESEDRKKAYVVLGQIRERLGDFNLAVDAYLLAEKAGVPPADIAGLLSRIYGLEVGPILSKPEKPKPVQAPVQPVRIELSMPVSGLTVDAKNTRNGAMLKPVAAFR